MDRMCALLRWETSSLLLFVSGFLFLFAMFSDFCFRLFSPISTACVFVLYLRFVLNDEPLVIGASLFGSDRRSTV